MNVKVTWSNGLTFTGTAQSGFSVPLGGDPSVGGNDDGFRPLELFAIGLAGCTAMDVISILQKKRQKVAQFEVRIHTERAEEHPRTFTDVHIEYLVTGENIEKAAVERAIELSETKYCPAQAMLKESVPISSSYQIIESIE
jgi:putative redox protein